MGTTYFTRELFTFLNALAKNNERDWFEANKDRYQSALKEPALRFIADFEPKLLRISPEFRADAKPVGGSLFRIHNDRRFHKDKPPYKTHCGIQFRHRAGKDVHAPGFYLHLEPAGCFVGMGLWHPEPKVAVKVREAIVERGRDWRKAVDSKRFTDRFTLGGESLKRPPRGFDAEHPRITDLMRKDFIATASLRDEQVLNDGFMKEFVDLCKRGAPLMEFLCRATGVGF